MLEDAQILGKAALGGARFIASHENGDGNLGEVSAFHKSVWALNNMGLLAISNRIVSWVKKNRMNRDGTIQHRLAPAASPMLESFHRKTPTYRESCFVVGAQRLGRYDVSMRVFDAAGKNQNRRYGGVLDPNPRNAHEGEMNPVNTAFFGFAAIATGRLEEAEAASRYFERVIDLQENLDERYYTVLNTKGELIRRFPKEERQLYLFEPKAKGDVFYWMIGMPMGLFAQLYGVTKKGKYLERAEWLYRLHRKCPDQVWKTIRSGKSAWALAYLASLTGNGEYAERAEKIMRSIASLQGADGSWNGSVEATGEMTIWASEVLKLLE